MKNNQFEMKLYVKLKYKIKKFLKDKSWEKNKMIEYIERLTDDVYVLGLVTETVNEFKSFIVENKCEGDSKDQLIEIYSRKIGILMGSILIKTAEKCPNKSLFLRYTYILVETLLDGIAELVINKKRWESFDHYRAVVDNMSNCIYYEIFPNDEPILNGEADELIILLIGAIIGDVDTDIMQINF